MSEAGKFFCRGGFAEAGQGRLYCSLWKREEYPLCQERLNEADGYSRFIMFLHYPPTNIMEKESAFTQIAEKYGAEQVIYAHCHGEERFYDSIRGEFHGVRYSLASGDFLRWMPMKVYFYGDSNTYGYDPRDVYGGRYPANCRWTDILQKLVRPDVSVIADGMNGRTIPNQGYALEYLKRKLRDAAPIDLFAVMLGTNDVLNSSGRQTGQMIRKMEKFCEALGCMEEMQIALITPPPIRIAGEAGRAFQSCMEQVCAGYREIANRHGWFFIDTEDWNLDLAYDGVHFSEQGHKIPGASKNGCGRRIIS